MEVKLTSHHRRPRSLGGLPKSRSNLSYVKEGDHQAWHTMFGNMNAYQICNLINSLPIRYKPSDLFLTCQFINGHPVTICGNTNCSDPNGQTFYFAWRKLFGNMKKFRNIVEYINNVFLDPSYHLYVVTIE